MSRKPGYGIIVDAMVSFGLELGLGLRCVSGLGLLSYNVK